MTGLTAARELLGMGWQVTLYEASSTLGGLAAGMPYGGSSLERTYHHLFRSDLDILSLVEDLGVQPHLEWHESSVGLYRDGVVHDFSGPVDLLRFTPLPFPSRVRLGLVSLFLQRYRNWRALAGVPALSWMRRWSGRRNTEVIWGPLLRGKFADHADRVSMAWLWARLHVRVNSRERGHGEQLGYFNGGFAVLIESLVQDCLRSGLKVVLAAGVDELAEQDGRVLVQAQGQELVVDAVVATVPSHVFARMLPSGTPADFVQQLQRVDYLGALCLVFSSAQDLGRHYWVNINEPDAPFLVFLNHTKLVPPERYEGRHVYYIGAYLPHEHSLFGLSDDGLLDAWLPFVKHMYPEFDRAQVQDVVVTRFRNAQHVVDTSYAEHIPPHRTPVRGVYLANFSQIFPEDRGTNYAVREGRRIAELVDADLADGSASGSARS
jgi:protoporphyrinogen oxidase